MKRIILSILVAAICTAGHAQSITGCWKGSPVKESQNGIESINTTDHVFKADVTFTETSNVSASIAFPINKGVNGEKAILTLTPGTLEYRNDDGLTYSFKRL